MHIFMVSNGNGKQNNGNGAVQERSAYKFLFVSWESLSGDLAWRLAQEGHEVKFFSKSEEDQDVCDGFVQKIGNWEEQKDWADVIVFDDEGFGKFADALRKSGKFVIGGSEYTDRLEADREFGQEEMKRAGMVVLPHWDFADYDEALTFIRENPGRYIFKPSGGVSYEQKGILFIGEEESGADLIEVLEHNKKTWSRKIKKFQLQKVAQGVEVAVGAFFNGHDFILPINVNFEHKKLFPGEIGPYTGEMGCYDEETQVLTGTGWKYFRDVKKSDEIASLNPKTQEVEYHKPSRIVIYDHHREMVAVKNQTLDILVTLDHAMWVQRRNHRDW